MPDGVAATATAAADPAATDAAATPTVSKPQWMLDDPRYADKTLSPTETNVLQAYQDVYGRAADYDGFIELATADASAGQDLNYFRRLLADAPEGRDAGKDPTQYGAVAITDAAVPESLKPYFDEWRARNDGVQLTDTTLKRIEWASQIFTTPQAYTAELDGLIERKTQVNKDGTRMRYLSIGQEGVDQMGGTIAMNGDRIGTFVLAPDGTQVSGANWQQSGVPGYSGFAATGNPKQFSIIGSVFGSGVEHFLDNITPDELKFAADPLGLYTGVLYGADAAKGATKAGSGVTGLSEKDLRRGQDLAFAAIGTAATIVTGGAAAPFVFAAGAIKAVNQRALGQTDNEGLIRGVAASSLTLLPGAGSLGGQVATGVAGAYIRDPSAEFDTALENAAWTVAGSNSAGLGYYARAAVDNNYSVSDASLQAAFAAGGSALAYATGPTTGADGAPLTSYQRVAGAVPVLQLTPGAGQSTHGHLTQLGLAQDAYARPAWLPAPKTASTPSNDSLYLDPPTPSVKRRPDESINAYAERLYYSPGYGTQAHGTMLGFDQTVRDISSSPIFTPQTRLGPAAVGAR